MRAELERAALELVRGMQRMYFEAQDLDGVRGLMEPKSGWIGVTGADLLHPEGDRADALASPAGYRVLDMPMVAEALDDDYCMVSGSSTIQEKDTGIETVVRLSALCHKSKDGLRIRQVHMSAPGGLGRVGAPTQAERERESILSQLLDRQRAQLDERDRDLDVLLNNLPGGVVCCDDSPELELIEFSQGFLDLYGYTRQEVRDLFHDRFSEMILPEDLEATWPVVREQLAKGNTKQIEYRIRRKDGEVLWILDRGQLVTREDGSGYFCCILLDVTDSRKASEALQSSLERHKIIMDQTNDIIFEWDVERDWLEVAGNWEKKFGYRVDPGPTAGWLEGGDHVHPDDTEALRLLFRQISDGRPYGEAEARMADGGGRYIWCRVRVTLQRAGGRRRAVGVIVDIDAEMRRTQRLQRLAERDALTGLYNKGTTQKLVENALGSTGRDELAALIILDVDDFKQINDTYGHLGGDAMLSDIAGALQGLFRQGDIIGRIGGDEFCVFLTGLKSPAVLERKAEEILRVFRDPQPLGRQGAFSCSLGIATAPRDGRDYMTLFQNADVSLYYAKQKGKNQYAFYSPGMDWPELRSELAASRDEDGHRIESDSASHDMGGGLAEYVFRVLYKANDITKALPSILEIVGRRFDVSRMYIYELVEEERFARNTFEWCNDGVEPQIDDLQRVPCAEIWDMLSALRDQGVLYCRDVSQLETGSREVLEAQGIRATLQCAVSDGGQLLGAVGFDECRQMRLWTQEQVDALTFIADIVSTFLVKGRARDRNRELMESLESILDHQKEWIYVVDPGTHQILYANRMTREVLPELEVGMQCHQAFFKRDSPCGDCPIRKLDPSGHAVGRVYSWVVGMEVVAQVDVIPWMGGRQAYLLSCHPVGERSEEEA